jgi:hypothetical protein
MNQAVFNISFGKSIRFLRNINMLKRRGTKDVGEHSDTFKSASRNNSHFELYRIAIANEDFEVLLTDESIFQFSRQDNYLRYCFIQNPLIFPSKEDYLTKLYGPEELLNLSGSELESLLAMVDDHEYEQYLTEQSLNNQSHILRYDLDEKGYLPLVHSYSHIHVGLNDSLRIPCSKILTPLQFTIFCIKHSYHEFWKTRFNNDGGIEELMRESKKLCRIIPQAYWIEREMHDLFLG